MSDNGLGRSPVEEDFVVVAAIEYEGFPSGNESDRPAVPERHFTFPPAEGCLETIRAPLLDETSSYAMLAAKPDKRRSVKIEVQLNPSKKKIEKGARRESSERGRNTKYGAKTGTPICKFDPL